MRLEKYLDDGDPIQRLGLDVFNVIYERRQRTFRHRCDPVAHILRRESRIVPDDADDRDIDLGEDIGGRPQNDNRPQNQNQQSQYGEGVRPS